MSDGIPPLLRPPVLDPTQRALRDLQATVRDNTPTRVRASPAVTKTAQTAAISTTNLIQFAKGGVYRVVAVAQCTTADAAAGTVTVTIGWTDRVGATTDANLTRVLTATGRNSRSYELQVQGDTAITYATSSGAFGTAQYALEIRVERLAD